MKEFSLEKYLANPNRKLITRDGREARILCTNRANAVTPIVALVKQRYNDVEVPNTYYSNGHLLSGTYNPSDIFFADEDERKHEGWVNVYGNITSQYIYPSEEEAVSVGKTMKSYRATCKIEWEE